MKKELRTAFAAANAAKAAAQFARTAEHLVAADSTAWHLVDKAIWLCQAAADKAEIAADSLDPEWADLDETVLFAHTTANEAAALANEASNNLIALAEANGHIIRR